jgi:hypothetical protein
MAESTVPVVITYRKAGTQPPVFLAGSFSEPEWQPQEMKYTTSEDGEHTFEKEIHVQPAAELQYKFRLGDGDWWALDETAPTVSDELGNLNNLLKTPSLPVRGAEQTNIPKADETASKDDKSMINGTLSDEHVGDSTVEAPLPTQEAQQANGFHEGGNDHLKPNGTAASSAPWSGYRDVEDEVEHADDRVPLFAHETGEYDTVWVKSDPTHVHDSGTVEYDVEVDPDDPNIEEMPTELGGILQTIQRIESEVPEDVTHTDIIPPSPVLPPRRLRHLSDQYGEYRTPNDPNSTVILVPVSDQNESAIESAEASPEVQPRRSLDPVMEEETISAPVVSVPSPLVHPSNGSLETPGSDDDEGVDLKSQENESTADKSPTAPIILETSPSSEAQVKDADSGDSASHPPEDTSKVTNPTDSAAPAPSVVAPAARDSEPNTSHTSVASSEQPGSSDQAKQRSASSMDRRIATPIPQLLDGREQSGWIASFLHLVFVDWVGGIFGRFKKLFGARRNTMIATTIAVAVIGLVLSRYSYEDLRRIAIEKVNPRSSEAL